MSTKNESESTERTASAVPESAHEGAPDAESADKPRARRVVRSASTSVSANSASRADAAPEGAPPAAGEAPRPPAAKAAAKEPQGSLLDLIAPRKRPALADAPPPATSEDAAPPP
ncbi:MAG TPA: hypothetical protein VL242_20470, partial [Sorangium sp.]|nr:hypothetical protein [Sorangium sp.]